MILRKVIAAGLFCVGLFCLAQAQVPLTGAGKGALGGAAGNAVTLDQVGTGATPGLSSCAPASYNDQIVTAALTNPGLIFVVVNASGISVTSPAAVWDFGTSNQSMALLVNQDATGGRQVMIFGLRNPASGNKQLRFTCTGVGFNSGFWGSVSFSHVNPASDAAAFPNFIGSNSPGAPNSITITTGLNNYAIAGFSSLSNTSVSDTQLFLQNTGTVWDTASNYKVTTGATDTLTASPGGVGTSGGGTIAHD